jgi:hypothetical protein
MNKNVYIGKTGEDSKTPIDWNAIFTGATDFASAYLGYKTAQQQGRSTTGGGTTTIVTPPSPMSQTTKTLLIGGGILAAGLIIYAITKKK